MQINERHNLKDLSSGLDLLNNTSGDCQATARTTATVCRFFDNVKSKMCGLSSRYKVKAEIIGEDKGWFFTEYRLQISGSVHSVKRAMMEMKEDECEC